MLTLANKTSPHLPPQTFLSDPFGIAMRGILFAYAGFILCPIHYWPFYADDVDNTWVFALNYAAAHHLLMGRDIVWTSGPLACLAAPMDIGNNLAQGLMFQTVLWIVIIAILWDLFFRAGFSLRNLAFFSVFVALSGPRYHHFPNPLGAGNLLLAGALILLMLFRLRGGILRYTTALVMFGIVPLTQFAGVLLVAGLVVGLIVSQVFEGRSRREIVLAALVPAVVAGVGYWLSIGSLHDFLAYMKASSELASGYNVAMSISGSTLESLAVLGVVALLAIALALLADVNRQTALFLGLILAVPLFVSIKHAIVRQDSHVVYIFSFVALALGLMALTTTLDRRRTITLTTIMLVLMVFCSFYIAELGLMNATLAVTGSRAPELTWDALWFKDLQRKLRVASMERYSLDSGIEPEIKQIVQHQPIASLSMMYSNTIAADLKLVLYPVLQRYSAYTPYLDKLNADWVREKGPRFLIFDGKSIDERHPWTETPAMWIEVYRWYNTRILGPHNLLLERRDLPRFTRFELLSHEQLRLGGELQIPTASQPVFWSMKCSLTTAGKLRALLYRVNHLTMTVRKSDGHSNDFRLVPAVLGSPSMGNHLPDNLAEFAEVFEPKQHSSFSVDKLSFGGPGMGAYSPTCDVEWLRPVL
jgi:hypothetical protein